MRTFVVYRAERYLARKHTENVPITIGECVKMQFNAQHLLYWVLHIGLLASVLIAIQIKRNNVQSHNIMRLNDILFQIQDDRFVTIY